jgi:peptide/nickel transport system substrate-binding protein
VWENIISVGNVAGAPTTNGIVQYQNWGDREAFDRGEFWTIQPDLALSWEQSPDGLSWTFRLVPDAEFHDGQPFTCEDAKWMIDTVRTGEGLTFSPRGVHLSAVTSVECADAATMVVRLSQPKPTLPDVLAFTHLQVFPRHLYGNDLDALRTGPSVGTGPFKVVEYIQGEKVVLEKNQDYWNAPFPYLDGIEIQFLDSPTGVTALRAGRLDVTEDAISGLSGGAADTLIQECSRCQTWPAIASTGLGHTLLVNHQRAPWNQPEVKDALSLAIDRKKFADVGLQGWGVPPTTGLYPPGTSWEMPYDRVKQVPGYNVDTPEENKQRARDLLAQAGYLPGDLTVTLYTWSLIQREAPPVLEDLAAIGIQADLEVLETARNYETLGTGAFDLHAMAFGKANYLYDLSLYEHYYTGSDRNYGRYSNAEVDRLIDEVSRTLDPEEQKRKAWDVGEIILREHGKIILDYSTYQSFLGENVRGLLPAPAVLSAGGAWQRHEHTWLAG